MIGNQPVFYRHWIKNGVFIINDLLLDNGNFLTYEQFVKTFSIHTNFLDYHGLIHSIKAAWWDFFQLLDYCLPNPVHNFYIFLVLIYHSLL